MTNGAKAAVAMAAAVAILAAASQAAIPIGPVPITMQTLAVTLAGALLGARWGTFAILVWLTLAALGLPLLAEGAGGIEAFSGPTAGYLFAFPAAAAVVGLLSESGWNGAHPARAFAAMLVGNAICLLLGWAWLALNIGPVTAWEAGVRPFLPGALVKSALGTLILWFAPHFQIAVPFNGARSSRGE